LEVLNYPNYEVIVVNDGSNDRTKEICRKYKYIRLTNQVNCGLSVARNVGMYSAKGEIVAYTDADCDADPDWLNYLVTTFQLTGKHAVGGPNFPPPEDAFIPACVAVSPGGPTHVLLDDSTAEHIAGCNMAFTRDVLKSIGGFDTQFRAAGDDVDICWRLQDAGYDIGFSPAAVVWHFRRNTVKDYLKQQRGYGKAEALVYFKHPDRFNLLGQARWLGRIYGDIASTIFVSKPVIYSGVFGKGLFQTLYASPAPVWSYLPVTLEWNLFSFIFLGVTLALKVNPLWAIVPFLITWASCIAGSLQARIDPRFSGPKGRILVAVLIYLGPFLRGYERYKWRITGLSKHQKLLGAVKLTPLQLCIPKHFMMLSFWSETGVERETLLSHMIDFLSPRKYFVKVDGGWSKWDLKVYQGIWARATVLSASENHGGTKRLIRFAVRSIPSSLERILGYALVAIAGLFFWLKLPLVGVSAFIIGVIAYLVIGVQKNLLLLRLSKVINQIANDQHLVDLSKQPGGIPVSASQIS
jgi:GT2 family glycosyltransferase